MPVKRAIALLLMALEDSLDMMELAQAQTPSGDLNRILIRRRRAAVVLRNRLSRKERPLHRSRAGGMSPTAAALIEMELVLLNRFDEALRLPGLDPDLASVLRGLRSEAEQARISLHALARNA